MNAIVIITIGLIGLIILQILFFISRYIKCPPDKLMVIYGRVEEGKSSKVLNGGAEFVWPVIQDYGFIDLKPYDLHWTEAYVLKDNESIEFSVSANIGVASKEPLSMIAAERLLGIERSEIENIATRIIKGQVNKTLSGYNYTSIRKNKNEVLQSSIRNVETDLHKIGFELFSLNFKDG